MSENLSVRMLAPHVIIIIEHQCQWVAVKAGLWTLDWTIDWTVDWTVDWILDRILDRNLDRALD